MNWVWSHGWKKEHNSTLAIWSPNVHAWTHTYTQIHIKVRYVNIKNIKQKRNFEKDVGENTWMKF